MSLSKKAGEHSSVVLYATGVRGVARRRIIKTSDGGARLYFKETTGEKEGHIYSGEVPFFVFGEEDEVAKGAVLSVFSLLSEGVRREIERSVHSRARTLCHLEEIRISKRAGSSIVLADEEFPLSVRLSENEVSSVVRGLCHGTPFAYREEMAQGYLPFGEGVRVGVIGEGHYDEGGHLVSVSDIHTLTFRIPHMARQSENIRILGEHIREHTQAGCLLLSAPRVGKTTFLRALCRYFAGGEHPSRVAVVDTRREFLGEDCEGVLMDVLIGYRRKDGALVALRTLAPRYLVMDEVGSEDDVRAVLSVMASGVPLLASAHARTIEEARRRVHLQRMLACGAFDTVLTLCRKETGGVAFTLSHI